MPTTPCLPQLRFDFHPSLPVAMSFDSPRLSPDAGVLLLRPLDDQLGLSALITAHVPDLRDPRFVQHPRRQQIRQRLFALALGYEDQNDAAFLRHDPLFRTACDAAPNDPDGLSSQPTLSRLEHAPRARDVVRLHRALEAHYVASLAADTTCVVLDVDGTADPVHGQQAFSSFHGHYGETMFYPLHIFDGDGRLVSTRLRPGNAGNNRYATPMLVRLIRAIKARLPEATVVVRADSGFSSPRLYEALDTLNDQLGEVHYIIGLEKNAVLRRLLEPELAAVNERAARSHQAERAFTSMMYQAKSWSRARYVVAKAECLPGNPGKDNPRFVVTTLDHVPPRLLYEQGYCGRGEAENRIKDLKRVLHSDRLSCGTYVANAFRLLMHAFAYVLLDALRRKVSETTPTAPTPQMDTLQKTLLKVVAVVKQSVRRILVQLSPRCVDAPLWVAVARHLGATLLPSTIPHAA